ncbi:Na+/H+ antiporter NhaC family protein [Nocardiopsis trehalosi]|jgi:Na+/H+ antiporter NhaC|uniref:Na+/H+ antiporter NhaC family protein n=1 Tax=Nocardiopsis trehalosi TaxID=109329 RepID=UPI000A01EAB6|nr:Na+/H+ antiporter NhaC family protein [Nocardiopsis trehalosi]
MSTDPSAGGTPPPRADGAPGSPGAAAAAPDRDDANAYDVDVSPARRRLLNAIAVLGLAASVAAGFLGGAPTIWGLLPIALYAALALLGMDIVVATLLALVSGVAIAQMSPLDVGTLLGESLADQVTMIGLIIVLGSGVGEVLKVTGVASTIVRGVMRVVGERSRMAVTIGVMLASLLLVAGLGTLAGALAIATPILIPIAARMGFTRSATASMIFIGGCAGLTIAPFAGSNVAIMDAAEVGYLAYLGYGAAPLAVLSLLMGLVVVPWMQRRTVASGDLYTAAEVGAAGEEDTRPARAGRATAAFLVLLVASVAYATATNAGTAFPLLALPLLAAAAGLAGGLGAKEIAATVYRGAARLISILLLFWLLAGLFILIERLQPFEVILDMFGDGLAGSSAFVFAVLIALLGWVGVPGATAAQVVLLDQVFGDLAGQIGVGAGAWVIVLLFASKADTYGPFPNANMVGAMGLARSSDLRNMMITGWALLVPACVMYTAMLLFLTR